MKFKKATLIALALFYSFFLFLVSSDTLLSDLLQVRQNIVIHSKEKEILLLSKQSWNMIISKDEFKYKNNYYDVKNVVVYKNFVKVEVVKDMLEHIIKGVTKNLNQKSKSNTLQKFKKSIILYHSKITSFGFPFITDNRTKNYFSRNCFKNKYITSIFRPPSFN
jgi:hypothetical protein